MTSTRIFVFSLLLTTATLGFAAEAERVKENHSHNFKVTLLSEKFRWLPNSEKDPAFAVVGHESGVRIIVSSYLVEPGLVFDDDYVNRYRDFYFENSNQVETSNQIMTFLGAPAFQIDSLNSANDKTFSVRLILANGIIYKIQLEGTADQLSNLGIYDDYFAVFSFIDPGDYTSSVEALGMQIDEEEIVEEVGLTDGQQRLLGIANFCIGIILTIIVWKILVGVYRWGNAANQ